MRYCLRLLLFFSIHATTSSVTLDLDLAIMADVFLWAHIVSLSRCDEETLSTLFSGPVPSTYVSMGQLEQPLAAISLA